jgi:tetratricopeptide (TPR) repeat protein
MRKSVYYIFTCLFLALSSLTNSGFEVVAASYNEEASNYFRKAQDAQYPEDQIANYQKAIKLDPTFMEAYINLGVVYIKTERFEEAIDILQKAHNINPEHWLIKKNLVVAYINLGVSYGRSGRIMDGISAYHEALVLDPQDTLALQNLSAAYNNLGVQSYYQGELQKACEAFNKALEVNPNNRIARDNLQSLFPSGCPPVNTPTPSLDRDRIKEMVQQAITKWQSRTGRRVEESDKIRIVNEYLSSVEECGTNARSLQKRDIEEHVSAYLDYDVRDGSKPQFVVCDPLQW